MPRAGTFTHSKTIAGLATLTFAAWSATAIPAGAQTLSWRQYESVSRPQGPVPCTKLRDAEQQVADDFQQMKDVDAQLNENRDEISQSNTGTGWQALANGAIGMAAITDSINASHRIEASEDIARQQLDYFHTLEAGCLNDAQAIAQAAGIDTSSHVDKEATPTGYVRRTFDGGIEVEDAFFTRDGQPDAPEGYARVTMQWGLDHSLDTRWFDVHNAPVLVKGVARTLVAFSEHGEPLQQDNFGVDGKPILDPDGCARKTWVYDETSNNKAEESCYNADGTLRLNTAGFARVRYQFPPVMNAMDPLATTWFGVDGKPMLYKGCARLAQTRADDNELQVTGEACYGAQGQPIVGPNGYFRLARSFASVAHVKEETYYGPDNQPIIRADVGYARIDYTYDADDDNVTRTDLFGADLKPIIGKDGFASHIQTYTQDHLPLIDLYLGADGKPILSPKDGYASKVLTYDAGGFQVSEAYTDAAGKPMVSKAGFATETFRRDKDGNILEDTMTDAGGRLMDGPQGYAHSLWKQDAKGNAVEIDYFAADGSPARAFAVERMSYDDKNQVVADAYFTVTGQPATYSDGYSRVTYVYNEANNPVPTYYNAAGGVIADPHK